MKLKLWGLLNNAYYFMKKRWVLTNGILGFVKKNHGVGKRNGRLEWKKF